jgi:hypothetical protein
MKILLPLFTAFISLNAIGQTNQTNVPTSQSQNSYHKQPPAERAILVLRMMSSKVNLNENQQLEVRQILVERENARDLAFQNHAGIKDNAKPDLKAANKSADLKLQKVLSAEQWSVWEKFRKEEAQKRKEQKANKTRTPANSPTKEEDFY